MMPSFDNIPDLLKYNALNIPNDIFLSFNNKRYTFLDVDKAANKVANYLEIRDVGKGDHVAIIMRNCPEYLFIWFGLAKLGAVMVPINIHLKGEGLEYILNHSDSKLVIIDNQFFEKVSELSSKLLDLEMISLNSLIENVKPVSEVRNTSVNIEKEDIMSIIYTSGTTGLPKGVLLPHFSYINTGLSFRDKMVNIKKEDILYTCLPLFHCNAQQLSVMGAMLAGSQLVLSEKFSASQFWKEIHESKATIFNYIGSILTVLYKQPYTELEKNNTITRAFGGAAPKEIWTSIEERFDFTIIEGFGLSETATVCLCNPTDQIRTGSIGLPLSNVEVKIVDNGGKKLGPNEEGEIVVKEKSLDTIFKGYYKMPHKTKETIKYGWFHTGDRGYQDADGFFYFKDRLKDCIRYRGENISSYEIESIVNKHSAVKEAVAIGVPSDLTEEDVKVVLILQPDVSFDYFEFIDYCKDNMAYYMVPRYIEIREDFPKTATERVQKHILREEGIRNCWDRYAEELSS